MLFSDFLVNLFDIFFWWTVIILKISCRTDFSRPLWCSGREISSFLYMGWIISYANKWHSFPTCYFILQNNFVMDILIRNKTHQFTITHLSVQKDIVSAYLYQFTCYQRCCHLPHALPIVWFGKCFIPSGVPGLSGRMSPA